jgi:hypothetical protein
MMRRWLVLALCLSAACGGRQHPGVVAPQTPNEALARFMSAVKAKDLTAMGNLWGSDRGPASTFWDADRLNKALTTIQVYLDHKGYRVIEGPLPAQPLNPTYKNVPSRDKLRDFRIELQRQNCNRVTPITLVQTDAGGWLVYDVHIESLGNPAAPCQPESTGTPR